MQEAGLGKYARLHLINKPKQVTAEASSSTVTQAQATEEIVEEPMEDVIITVPVDYNGTVHDVTVQKDDTVYQIILRYAEKTGDSNFVSGYELWTDEEKVPTYASVRYAVERGLITYGKKLRLMVSLDPNPTPTFQI